MVFNSGFKGLNHYQFFPRVLVLFTRSSVIFLFLWHFDPIPGHGLPLRGYTITLIGRTTIGKTPLDE